VDATYTAPTEIDRIQRLSLVVGVIFLVIFGIGSFMGGAAQFFHSYLLGFIFWNGVAVGCLALLMLQYLIRGSWGLAIRRVLEAGTRTLWLTLLLFIPLIFGLKYIFPWLQLDRPDLTKEAREIIEARHAYLNVGFFVARTAIFFFIWLTFTLLLNRFSSEQDRTAERRLSRLSTQFSGPGTALFVLTVTFASVDWMMSLDPTWYSTIFGLIFVIGWTLSAFSLVIAVMVVLHDRPPFAGLVGKPIFHDLGKLLLAFVMVWAYFNFSQFLIIWSGNLPEEGKWYFERLSGGWQYVALALVLLQFVLPFVLLLSRDLKRNAKRLLGVAVLVFLMRFVDLYWVVIPAFDHAGFHSNVLSLITNIAAALGIGGIWFMFFAYQLKQRPLLPLNDPYMDDFIAAAHADHH
jgi:hypothetical protein